jgi:hypothetical protein
MLPDGTAQTLTVPMHDELKRYVLSRYHDYKDVFLQMHELRLRSLAERGF